MIICQIDGYDYTVRIIVPSDQRYNEGQAIRLGYSKIFVFDVNGERIK